MAHVGQERRLQPVAFLGFFLGLHQGCFHFDAIGDVGRYDQARLFRFIVQLMRHNVHIDELPVFLLVAPDAGPVQRFGGYFDILYQPVYVLLGANIFERALQEFMAGIAVVVDGGFIHLQKVQRLLVVNPHGSRVVFKEVAVLAFTVDQGFVQL